MYFLLKVPLGICLVCLLSVALTDLEVCYIVSQMYNLLVAEFLSVCDMEYLDYF